MKEAVAMSISGPTCPWTVTVYAPLGAVDETVNTPVTTPFASTLHVGAPANNPAGVENGTGAQAPAPVAEKPAPKIAMDTPLTPDEGLRTIFELMSKLTFAVSPLAVAVAVIM